MWWTLVLMSTGIGGLWLAAKHWFGWALYLGNEVLWFIYAITIGAQPLALMALVWGAVGTRNLFVTRKAQRDCQPG